MTSITNPSSVAALEDDLSSSSLHDEDSTAASSSTSDEQSPVEDGAEVPSAASEDDSVQDPYQKIIATLREQIKSTNEELVRQAFVTSTILKLICIVSYVNQKKNGKVTNQNVKRVAILRRQKVRLSLQGYLKICH